MKEVTNVKIKVLGTEYTVTHSHNDPQMEDMDGFCDETTKEKRPARAGTRIPV